MADSWRYLKRETRESKADRVVSVIRRKILLLAKFPDVGHERRDLTSAQVKFFLLVYSYLIVYRPKTVPLQVVSVLHGRRGASALLDQVSRRFV